MPKISFIIPTLNAARLLPSCLDSIESQNYPKRDIEIVIADGGSNDNTLSIARKYGAHVFSNPLRTAESGKAVGVKNSTGDLICFVDSDNIIEDENWLNIMIKPLLEDADILGSEPIRFSHKKELGIIDRYCALMGMNDPLCYWIGSYEKECVLSGTWTGLDIKTEEKEGYKKLFLVSGSIPTIGANGCMFRKSVFDDNPNLYGDYLFDMDTLEQLSGNKDYVTFAKVDTGIIHLYCESDIRRFSKKQYRRVKDFLYRRPLKDIFIKPKYDKRSYKYGHESQMSFGKALLKFILYNVLLLPLILQAIKGYIKKPDTAWFLHPVLCLITFFTYGWGAITSLFNSAELSRENW